MVEIPEAEPIVRSHRERLDANARLGVPAHITVLFPFMPPDQIDDALLGELRRLFAATETFGYRLDRTAWFGDEVLWLAPSDPRPFHALTERAVDAFPECLPYDGQFPTVVPHLTVAHGCPLEDMRRAEADVTRQLPVDGRATKVTLLTQDTPGGRWATAASFALG